MQVESREVELQEIRLSHGRSNFVARNLFRLVDVVKVMSPAVTHRMLQQFSMAPVLRSFSVVFGCSEILNFCL